MKKRQYLTDIYHLYSDAGLIRVNSLPSQGFETAKAQPVLVESGCAESQPEWCV